MEVYGERAGPARPGGRSCLGIQASSTPLGIRPLWPLPDIFHPLHLPRISHRLAANSDQRHPPPSIEVHTENGPERSQ